MAEVKIEIGGRTFEVACRRGEEHFLKSAAAMLDNEAAALNDALGRMPETRMLLMAGLMLADKTASLEDQLRQLPESSADTQNLSKRNAHKKHKLLFYYLTISGMQPQFNCINISLLDIACYRNHLFGKVLHWQMFNDRKCIIFV